MLADDLTQPDLQKNEEVIYVTRSESLCAAAGG